MDEEGQCLLYMNKQIDRVNVINGVYRIITRNLINTLK